MILTFWWIVMIKFNNLNLVLNTLEPDREAFLIDSIIYMSQLKGVELDNFLLELGINKEFEGIALRFSMSYSQLLLRIKVDLPIPTRFPLSKVILLT
jgi:hypothetical protein